MTAAARWLPSALLLLALAGPASARPDHVPEFTFENGAAPGMAQPDDQVVHGGRYSARLERDSLSASTFSAFFFDLPVDFKGDSVELRGWMKFENVSDFVGLWQRQDGEVPSLQFDNMGSRRLRGTADWAEYRVVLPLSPQAREVYVGALLAGRGKLWVDDIQVRVDGRSLAEVPEAVIDSTALDRDHEFDAGSKLVVPELTPARVDNLVLLGKVWGFLKYHHPAIVAGGRHWDYDLFRALPPVLAADDREGGRRAIAAWVASLGEPKPCSLCVKAPVRRPGMPRLAWIADRRLFGADLSARLVAIHARRPNVDEQFYVARFPNVGNPDFRHENAYPKLQEVDAGYRLLALYRFWNMVEYWFPDRDVMGEDWDGVLREFVPRLLATPDRDGYAGEMMALIARVHDTHANLWSSLEVRPPRGPARVPVLVRFVEDRAVVSGYMHPALGPASGLRVGDEIRAVDGAAVDALVKQWRPMYAASNDAAMLRDMGRHLLRGAPGPARLSVVRDGNALELEAARVPSDSLDRAAGTTHDLPGPAFRRIGDDIAYLKLSSVQADRVGEYLKGCEGARCLVVDIRNYPSEFVVFALGQHLVDHATAFATFTAGDTRNPGAFDWTHEVTLQPQAPRLDLPVAILVDEVTQSSAEYTTMALSTHPGAVVVGSTTAGADGNVSMIPLPGGLRTMFSGLGVFYPDRRPTQRVGIVPDLVVRPTLAGIRAGRDEVLEAAVRRVLGRDMTDAERAAALTPPATP
jgi:C-terminal processing protease CtpA/Prc